METEQLYQLFLDSGGRVSTDSRKIECGALFFALKGENFNGNEYASAALDSGAGHAVVDDAQIYERLKGKYGQRIILVEDTLKALQQLARYNRLKHRLPLIAITGTNGKTTTKELINAVLSKRYKTVCTEGNLNNHIGVPLTLLKINDQTEIAIIEMGASAPGEIATLAELAAPSFGIITNVGRAHLLGFGSFEGVKKTKGELYANLGEHKKIAFVNVDNPDLVEMAEHYAGLHIVPYGVKNNCVQIIKESGNPYLKLAFPAPDIKTAKRGELLTIKTKLIGGYNADNVMAALSIGLYLDIPVEKAIEAIEEYNPSNNRSQLKKTARNTLIIDAYNANPTSMRAALENFRELQFSRKSLIIGDMLELGADSLNEHTEILKLALSLRLNRIYAVGAEFKRAYDALEPSLSEPQKAELSLYKDSVELKEYFAAATPKGETFLIKGSRGMRLERVIDEL